MRRILGVVMALVASAPLWAEEAKPVLVLDSGGHTAQVKRVLFTPDGKELITVAEDKTIRFWDVASGEPLRVLRPPVGPGSDGMLYAAALSPDGATLAVGGYGWTGGDNPIYLIDLAAGRVRRTLTGHSNVIGGLAFSPDGKTLASASADNTARLWDAESGRCRLTLEGHKKQIKGVAFAPGGRQLATASHDGTARVWSAETGECTAVLKGHAKEVRCIAWSPDGKRIVTGSDDESVRLWAPDGTSLRAIERLGNHIASVTFTPRGDELLVTQGAKRGGGLDVLLLRVETGEERVRFGRHTNTVLCGAISPDGSLAATAGGDAEEVYLWRTKDAAVAACLAGRGQGAWAAAWSADGAALAWGNSSRGAGVNAARALERTFRPAELALGPAPGDGFRRAQPARGGLELASVEGKPRLVEVRRGERAVATLELSNEYDVVRCFTLLAGDRAAAGSNFGLYLYDARSGKRLREFLGHTGDVWAVAPSPDGRLLLSASGDQTVRVWDPEQDEPLLSLFAAGEEWVAWTPEGYYACSPGGEKLMGWHVNRGKDQLADYYPAGRFRKALHRPDVIRRLLACGSLDKALEEADKERGKKTERTEVAKLLPPVVVITSPERPGVKLTGETTVVRAKVVSVGGHAVTGARLLIDGQRYLEPGGTRRFPRPVTGEETVEWKVKLSPGPHTLRVLADSEVSEGSAEVNVVQAGDTDELPRLFVLAIGISEYEKDKLRLRHAAKDAEAIAEVFQHAKPLYRAVEAKTLTDGKAKRAAVLAALRQLRKDATQRDVVVVFFSGHGARDEQGRFYLLPADADPDDVVSTGISEDDLKAVLASLPGRVLLLLDACHAGVVGGDGRKGPPLTDDLVRDLKSEDSGVIVMCSSRGREVSEEKDGQGYFTRAVTEGLSGKARRSANGAVYLSALDDYVIERVKELTNGRQHPVTAKDTKVGPLPLTRP